MGKAQRDPAREKFWRDALRRQKGGGLTVRAFCAEEELAKTAFHAWRRILRERDAERRPAPALAPAPAFVPVVVREDEQRSNEPILIELRGGRALRLAASTPAGRVAAIARAIEATTSPAPDHVVPCPSTVSLWVTAEC